MSNYSKFDVEQAEKNLTSTNPHSREVASKFLAQVAKDFQEFADYKPCTGAASFLRSEAERLMNLLRLQLPEVEPWTLDRNASTYTCEISTLAGNEMTRANRSQETEIKLPVVGWVSLTWFSKVMDPSGEDLGGWRYTFKPLHGPTLAYLVIND